MPAYVDKAYYDDTFLGEPIADIATFNRLAKRASEVIDQITNYSIKNYEFTQLATFIQEQVKKATASQVEYYAFNGGYEAVNSNDTGSVKVGSFSYGGGSSKSENNRIGPNVIDYLAPIGLLYSGIGVHHGY